MASSKGLKVSREAAKDALEHLWEQLDDPIADIPEEVVEQIETVINSDAVANRYILVTGLLAKYINVEIHPRSIQAKSLLPGAYDARSLCHRVLVPFEKTKGYLFGLSNEPIVGKAARHPEHSKENAQLKYKDLAVATHDALEFAHTTDGRTVEAMLTLALKLGRERGKNQVLAIAKVDANLHTVIEFATQFLKEADGGARLAAVVGAYLMLLNPKGKVRVYPPNYSDKYAKTVGDVEIIAKKKKVSAYECKHRPMNLDDVKHGIKKAEEAGVQEYVYVCAEGIVKGQESSIADYIESIKKVRDAAVLNVFKAIPLWSVMLNPSRRERFGLLVSDILRQRMKRDTSANAAATLWNSLK